jgi:5'-3' exonuclease
MGIQNLNKLLKEQCADSLRLIPLSELSGKKIAVDISIYLYKYTIENSLIENIYLMLSVFRYYNIIPIFIFDGKPPTEKKELLLQRLQKKKVAQEEYNVLNNKMINNNLIDEDEKQHIISTMEQLKKKFIYIDKHNIETVKQLIHAYGASYYEAPREADEVCANLFLKGKVWACLSEDMDMFAYGVKRVIRYFSLLNHTAVLYNLKGILKTLEMTQKEFREVCVLSGTDYNIHAKEYHECSSPNLYEILHYFKKYKKECNEKEFYTWLFENKDCNETLQCIKINDYALFQKVCNMFDLLSMCENDDTKKVFDNIVIEENYIQKKILREILQKHGFIFPLKDDNSI